MPIPCDDCHMPNACKAHNECRDATNHDVDGNRKAPLEAAVDAALHAIKFEVMRAMTKHPKGMHSSHEAFGVIYEEFNVEFAEAMKANDHDAQKIEMIQTGAMAVRALVDVYHVGK